MGLGNDAHPCFPGLEPSEPAGEVDILWPRHMAGASLACTFHCSISQCLSSHVLAAAHFTDPKIWKPKSRL